MTTGKLIELPDGQRLLTCPFYLLRKSPQIGEVARLYSWRLDGCLNPQTLTTAVRSAVEAFAAGASRGEVDRINEQS